MKQIVKKIMTVKQVESLSEKEKNEYRWTLSKTIEIEGKDIIKPDKDTQSILQQILDKFIILEDGKKQLVQGQANMQRQIDFINNVIKINNLKTK